LSNAYPLCERGDGQESMGVSMPVRKQGPPGEARHARRFESSFLPFVLIACGGQLAALLTPGSLSLAPFAVSTAILLVVVADLTLPRRALGTGEATVLLVAYVVSVGFVMAAEGFHSSGSGQLLLLPLIAAALYLPPFASFVSSAAVLVTLLMLSVGDPDGTTARRLLTWMAVCVLVAVPIHGLRRRLVGSAAADERRRIARDLHDGLAQELSFIATKARSVSRDVANDDARAIANSAERALDEARRAIAVLSADRSEDFSTELVRVAEDVAARHGAKVDVEVDGQVSVDAEQGEQLLRIVREAISNAVRHGRAAHVHVRVWSDAGFHLVIEDDGTGFDPASQGHGFGLVSMRERAAALGGTFFIGSAPDAGATIEVLVP
jgi:signal transduction histidine kinase